jgi:hypothetical protein
MIEVQERVRRRADSRIDILSKIDGGPHGSTVSLVVEDVCLPIKKCLWGNALSSCRRTTAQESFQEVDSEVTVAKDKNKDEEVVQAPMEPPTPRTSMIETPLRRPRWLHDVVDIGHHSRFNGPRQPAQRI